MIRFYCPNIFFPHHFSFYLTVEGDLLHFALTHPLTKSLAVNFSLETILLHNSSDVPTFPSSPHTAYRSHILLSWTHRRFNAWSLPHKEYHSHRTDTSVVFFYSWADGHPILFLAMKLHSTYSLSSSEIISYIKKIIRHVPPGHWYRTTENTWGISWCFCGNKLSEGRSFLQERVYRSWSMAGRWLSMITLCFLNFYYFFV